MEQYPLAEQCGPYISWEGAAPSVVGLDYTEATRAVVTVFRPTVPASTLTWDTQSGSLTFTTQSATALVLNHVFSLPNQPFDIPFVVVKGNNRLVEYQFQLRVYFGSTYVDFPIKCQKFSNKNRCCQ